MCGIGGWFGAGATGNAATMLSALAHRGPDGRGMWQDPDGRACLVHTRLAILELSDAAAQPMRHDDSLISFNGEIYNFRGLQDELASTDEDREGNSDTAVLLRLLVRDGIAALPKLAGMFAFAWFDCKSGRGLLARDAFGIKPLYYAELNGGIAFGSEVRTLRPFLTNSTIDAGAMRDTLMWGSVPEPATLVTGIKELPAGCFLEWDGSKATLGQWYRPQFATGAPPADPVSATRAALQESVRRHLVSDVPVGIFLSGGIDSTAVVALARESLGPKADLRTFSVGFDDPAYDEAPLARLTARHFGTVHTEWRMSEAEGRDEVANYLAAMDQPTIDGFNTWCVSKLAQREGVKVVLSGLGGDELFGGYGSFVQVPRLLRFHRSAGPLRYTVAAALRRAAPVGSRWRRASAFLRGPGTALAAFHAQRGIFTEAEADELTRSITGSSPAPANWMIDGLPRDPGDTVSYLEVTRYMRNQLLRDSDVFSMAHGLELRVPFVDARLFDTLAAIPASVRLRPAKQLLVEAVPEIPHWVRNQPKRGFRFPFEEWMRGDFGDVLAAADERSTVALVSWYRRWALAAVLLKGRRRADIERLRIFIVGTSFDPAYGGPAYSVPRMAMALADAGIDVGLWAPDQSASSSQLLAPASPVRRLTGAASEALREFGKADIIHDNGIWLRHNHRLARHALATRVPRVVSTRGMLEPWAMSHKRTKKRIAWALYQRRDLASARLHHATSDVEANHLHELGLGVPVHVIPNGVDIPPVGGEAETRSVRDRARGKRIALFLGRLYPVKGLPMLVEAWARVRPEGWCLQIAGPDEAGHRSVVERTIAIAGLSEVISFVGPLAGEAKRGALLNADLFVLPTHSESFGMSVAEALAHALPVLTTTAAPWPALAEQGCGWWVEPSVDGLAEGLYKATAEDSETLRSMGARGRHMVSLSYGWDCVTRQLITMYEEVV